MFTVLQTKFRNAIDYINEKCENFRDLNKLVGTRYDSKIKVFFVSLQMVFQMYWLEFLQNINTSVKHLDSKRTEISYTLNGHIYKLVVLSKKGPLDIESVLDGYGNNISLSVFPYLGPNRDWHNIQYTPKFWGKTEMTFIFNTGKKRSLQRMKK